VIVLNAQKEIQESVTDKIVEKVEDFIRRYNNLEYTIDSKATSIRYIGEGDAHPRSLSDDLADSISRYEHNRNNPSKQGYARICLIDINRAFANGVIKEGNGLVSKLEECTKKNTELENDLRKVSDELYNAKEKIEELRQQIPNFGSENA
jgi:phage shock protein A